MLSKCHPVEGGFDVGSQAFVVNEPDLESAHALGGPSNHFYAKKKEQLYKEWDMKSETQCITRIAVCGIFLIIAVVGAPVLGMWLERGADHSGKD